MRAKHFETQRHSSNGGEGSHFQGLPSEGRQLFTYSPFFVILLGFASKAGVGGRKERKTGGHGPKGRNSGERAKEEQEVGVTTVGPRR